MDFGRLLVAMATPFKDDLELDIGRAKELARRLEIGRASCRETVYI